MGLFENLKKNKVFAAVALIALGAGELFFDIPMLVWKGIGLLAVVFVLFVVGEIFSSLFPDNESSEEEQKRLQCAREQRNDLRKG